MSTIIVSKSTTQPITAEDLFLMSGGERYELIAGELKVMSPAGFQYGAITNLLSCMLSDFVRRHRLGLVLGAETGFILARRPDTVRGPDVSFVSQERIEQLGIPISFFPEAPDLAAEVVSPGNSASEMEGKAEDFLKAGTRLFWIVKPTHCRRLSTASGRRRAERKRLPGGWQRRTGLLVSRQRFVSTVLRRQSAKLTATNLWTTAHARSAALCAPFFVIVLPGRASLCLPVKEACPTKPGVRSFKVQSSPLGVVEVHTAFTGEN